MVKGMPIFDFKHDIVGVVLLGRMLRRVFLEVILYKGIFELIHYDVCGPMASPSLSGYLYYVQFIDDFSRKSWIYFLKAKSETNKY